MKSVEAVLGFKIPELLRRFYLEVANGGVADLFTLAQLVETREAYSADPPQEYGDPPWPPTLLPIADLDYLETSFLDASSSNGPVMLQVEDTAEDVGDPHCLVQQRPSLNSFLLDWLEGRDRMSGFRRTNNPEPGRPEIKAQRIEFCFYNFFFTGNPTTEHRIVSRSFAEFSHPEVLKSMRDRGNAIRWSRPIIAPKDFWWLPRLTTEESDPSTVLASEINNAVKGHVDLPQNTRDAPLIAGKHWSAWLTELKLQLETEFDSTKNLYPGCLRWKVEVDGNPIPYINGRFCFESVFEFSDETRATVSGFPTVKGILDEVTCCSHMTIYAAEPAGKRNMSELGQFIQTVENFSYGVDLVVSTELYAGLLMKWRHDHDSDRPDIRDEFFIPKGECFKNFTYCVKQQIEHRDKQVSPVRFARLIEFGKHPCPFFSFYLPNAPITVDFLNQLPSPKGMGSDRKVDHEAILTIFIHLAKSRSPSLSQLGVTDDEFQRVVEIYLLPWAIELAEFFLECAIYGVEIDQCPGH